MHLKKLSCVHTELPRYQSRINLNMELSGFLLYADLNNAGARVDTLSPSKNISDDMKKQSSST